MVGQVRNIMLSYKLKLTL